MIVEQIVSEICTIPPFDHLENKHIQETLEWVKSGSPIFRIQKPDIPDKHLVSYFIVLDVVQQKILLVDHKIAGLWLPAGGHVETNEHPRLTVTRECKEELDIDADFWQETPFFLTSTLVPDGNYHTDVSLWYILKKPENQTINFDPSEFHSIRWFQFDEIPFKNSDPHMNRFMNKLRAIL